MSDDLNTKIRVGGPGQTIRLSFPNLFVPKAAGPGAEPKFSATFLLPPDFNLDPLKLAVLNAAKNKWGDVAAKWISERKIKLPFKRQDEKSNLAGYTEGYYINASSKNRPGVVDAALQPIENREDVQAGMIVAVTLNAYAWEHPQNGKGVSFGLQNVMIVKDDGTRFGGGASKPEEDFADFKSVASSGAAAKTAEDVFGGI